MRLDHITINVTDMEASEDFYGNVLGLAKLENVDMGDHELHYFDLGHGAMLELIRYDDPAGEIHPDVKTKGIFRHLAFAVDDLDQVYARVLEAGTRVVQEPAYVEKLSFRNILIQDPNGVELEIIQRENK